jgi:hypothetical protein
MHGGEPECHVVQSCACIPDPSKQKGKEGGTWRDTTPIKDVHQMIMEQFYVLGSECKIGDATPSICEIPESMYPKLPPNALSPATKPAPTKPGVEPATLPAPEVQEVVATSIQLEDPDTNKEATPEIVQCAGQDGHPHVSLEEE